MTSPKPYFLFLPGLDGTGRLIEWQTPLYEHYEVIACTYPEDRKTTYEELADAAAERFVSISQGQPAVVLAESFGGGVALQFALRHPELIERLVLVNTFARFPSRFIIRSTGLFSYFLPRRRLDGLMRPIQSRMLFRPDLPQSDRDRFWEIVKDIPMSALGRRLRMIARLDLRSELPKINRPTLVMASPIDKTVNPKASRELVRLLPRVSLLEIPVGHATLIHPQVNVLEWLNDSRLW